MDNTEVAEALFGAIERGDIDSLRALCADDMQLRQNKNEPMDLETMITFTETVLRTAKNYRYENIVRTATPTGFVEEHRIRGTLPDGSELDIAACIVADLRDGKVADVREYVDGAAAAGLISALA